MIEAGCLLVDTLWCSETLFSNVTARSFCLLKTRPTIKFGACVRQPKFWSESFCHTCNVTFPVPDTQHGHRKQHFSLWHIRSPRVSTSRSRPAALEVDFSQAFDTINHDVLLNMAHLWTLENKVIRWIFAYLRSRRAACRFGNSVGLPSTPWCSAPRLYYCFRFFHFYVSEYPQSADLTTSYANDFTAA